jgi:penicillin-binding protein 1C
VQVLEAWLNLTPFRGEIEGIDAAARAIAGKPTAGWTARRARSWRRWCAPPNAPPERGGAARMPGRAGDEALCNVRAGDGGRRFRGDARRCGRRRRGAARGAALLSRAGERRVSSIDARGAAPSARVA